jgi:hypothetical protein
MNTKHFLNLTACISAFLLITGLTGHSSGATFIATYGDKSIPVTSEPDNYYKKDDGTWDGISTIYHTQVVTTDGDFALNSAVFGRHYDSDPARAGEWGLLNRQTLTGFNDPPWLLKHGLAPEFVGSPLYYSTINGEWTPVEASYVEFDISVGDGTDAVMFDQISLQLNQFYNLDADTDVWASTNSGGFKNAIRPTVSADPLSATDVYTFDLGAISLVSDTLQVRVYGMLGQDQGTFGIAVISGVVTPPPLPEPTSAMLLVGALASAGLRRKRSVNKI